MKSHKPRNRHISKSKYVFLGLLILICVGLAFLDFQTMYEKNNPKDKSSVQNKTIIQGASNGQ